MTGAAMATAAARREGVRAAQYADVDAIVEELRPTLYSDMYVGTSRSTVLVLVAGGRTPVRCLQAGADPSRSTVSR
jgi:hypothetical protein